MAHPYRRVCLDMDGVLCDFYRGVARLLDREALYDAYLVAPGAASHDYEFLDLPKHEIQERINEAGEDFWLDLPAYPWASELVSAAVRAAEGVSILSSPGRFTHAHVGKMRWLKRHGILSAHTDVILAHRKYLHAGHRDLLVDDYPRYLDLWTAAGGRGALVERAWNRDQPGLTEAAILALLRPSI